MVLGYPDALEAVPFREVHFPQRLLDDLAVGGGASAWEELEDADVHQRLAFDLAGAAFPAGGNPTEWLRVLFHSRGLFCIVCILPPLAIQSGTLHVADRRGPR